MLRNGSTQRSVASCCAYAAGRWSGSSATCLRARRYRIGEHPEIGLSGARKLAAVVRGRAAAGGALASWLKDRKQGPLGRWRGGLEGGSARASLPHIRRLERMLGKKLLSEVTLRDMENVVVASEAPATATAPPVPFEGSSDGRSAAG